jgi:asparagine synthase (glutamine-hydrolysing)
MCGIVGSFKFDNFSINDIKKMCSIIAHRGPDNTGVYFNKEDKIALGSVRLSILDISHKADQPCLSFSNRYTMVYNGEIYNFSLLKAKIDKDYKEINKSFEWKSKSDTEVLINGIELYGLKNMIKMCEGMFAFALWDKKKKKLYLVRDRIGEKPLYYGWHKGTFYFMSELKALKFDKNLHPKISKKSVNIFLKYGMIPCPNSIFESFYKLEPGSVLEMSQTNYKIEQYYKLESNHAHIPCVNTKIDIQKYTNELDLLLNQKVQSTLVADVPVGCFLSSGLDSSLISAIAQKNSKNKLETFTLFTEEDIYNEAKDAKKIARHIGSNHNELNLTKNLLFDYVEKMHEIFCEPLGDSSQIPTYALSTFAKKKVKVCLSGDGADEFYGGYNRYIFYKKYYHLLKKVPKFLLKLLAKTFNINLLNHLEWKISEKLKKIKALSKNDNFYEYYDELLAQSYIQKKDVLFNEFPRINHEIFLNNKIADFSFEDLMFLDQMIYLPEDIMVKVDRASMANSLEIRSPYLNHELVEFSKKLPRNLKVNHKTKEILRLIHKKYYPANLQFVKKGFSVNLKKIILIDLRDWSEQLLSKENLKKHEYFNEYKIEEIWKNYKEESYEISNTFMWNILVMQNWILKNNQASLR